MSRFVSREVEGSDYQGSHNRMGTTEVLEGSLYEWSRYLPLHLATFATCPWSRGSAGRIFVKVRDVTWVRASVARFPRKVSGQVVWTY